MALFKRDRAPVPAAQREPGAAVHHQLVLPAERDRPHFPSAGRMFDRSEARDDDGRCSGDKDGDARGHCEPPLPQPPVG